MGAKKQAEFKPVTTSAFDDIITCLAGILFLMIIAVVLDLRPPVIFTPTPIDRETNLKPIWIECTTRGELMKVDVDALRRSAEQKLAQIATEHAADQMRILSEVGRASVSNENYQVDLPAFMATQSVVVYPLRNTRGVALPKNINDISADNWLARQYTSLDTNRNYIVFLVRSEDTSYDVFRRARALAWTKNIPVAYELFDNNEPFRFGGASAAPGFR